MQDPRLGNGAMAQISGGVTYKLRGLQKFRDSLHSPSAPPVAKALKQWAARYRSFAQRRFVRLSAGGGEWPDLQPSTVRARRGGGRGIKILRDRGLLFGALGAPLAPGAYEQAATDEIAITVGYGGPGRHADGGTASIADIATFHHVGASFLPSRKIIVPPDDATVSSMAGDMERGLLKLGSDMTKGVA